MTGTTGGTGPRRIDLTALGAADAPSLAARVRAARLVCFPTDTVYGIGGAVTPAVVEALVAAKGREPGKPLQVVFPSTAALAAALPFGTAQWRRPQARKNTSICPSRCPS